MPSKYKSYHSSDLDHTRVGKNYTCKDVFYDRPKNDAPGTFELQNLQKNDTASTADSSDVFHLDHSPTGLPSVEPHKENYAMKEHFYRIPLANKEDDTSKSKSILEDAHTNKRQYDEKHSTNFNTNPVQLISTSNEYAKSKSKSLVGGRTVESTRTRRREVSSNHNSALKKLDKAEKVNTSLPSEKCKFSKQLKKVTHFDGSSFKKEPKRFQKEMREKHNLAFDNHNRDTRSETSSFQEEVTIHLSEYHSAGHRETSDAFSAAMEHLNDVIKTANISLKNTPHQKENIESMIQPETHKENIKAKLEDSTDFMHLLDLNRRENIMPKGAKESSDALNIEPMIKPVTYKEHIEANREDSCKLILFTESKKESDYISKGSPLVLEKGSPRQMEDIKPDIKLETLKDRINECKKNVLDSAPSAERFLVGPSLPELGYEGSMTTFSRGSSSDLAVVETQLSSLSRDDSFVKSSVNMNYKCRPREQDSIQTRLTVCLGLNQSITNDSVNDHIELDNDAGSNHSGFKKKVSKISKIRDAEGISQIEVVEGVKKTQYTNYCVDEPIELDNDVRPSNSWEIRDAGGIAQTEAVQGVVETRCTNLNIASEFFSDMKNDATGEAIELFLEIKKVIPPLEDVKHHIMSAMCPKQPVDLKRETSNNSAENLTRPIKSVTIKDSIHESTEAEHVGLHVFPQSSSYTKSSFLTSSSLYSADNLARSTMSITTKDTFHESAESEDIVSLLCRHSQVSTNAVFKLAFKKLSSNIPSYDMQPSSDSEAMHPEKYSRERQLTKELEPHTDIQPLIHSESLHPGDYSIERQLTPELEPQIYHTPVVEPVKDLKQKECAKKLSIGSQLTLQRELEPKSDVELKQKEGVLKQKKSTKKQKKGVIKKINSMFGRLFRPK